MDPSTRTQLEQILALQLKPELLVEQLIIENRLRTMSLNAFPVLEGIGFEGKRGKVGRGDQKLPPKSFSTPSIHSLNEFAPPPQHRKHRRRKPKQRQWWGFSNPPVQGEAQEFPAVMLPFDSTRKHGHGFQGLGSVTSLPKLTASKAKNNPPRANHRQTGDASNGCQVQYALAVVAPELETGKLKELSKLNKLS